MPKSKAERIEVALQTPNKNRTAFANQFLTGSYKEIIIISKEGGKKSLAFRDLKISSNTSNASANAIEDWGTYTGWLLGSDGCFYHGTFLWSGSEDNAIFVQDKNPYGDNYIGNEPRCMSDDEFDSFA